MLKTLYRALNVRPDEENQVLLLLCKGFFMGIFVATYQITAETIFLDRLGHLLLREAMFASGVLGVFTTALFAYFQNRVAYSKLAILNLLFVFLFTLGLYIAMYHSHSSWMDYFVFLMFIMTTPILAVILLGFWGVFGRMFDLRQSKRIIGGIDVGQILAAILASFSVPFISQFVSETLDLLMISCGSILISLLFLVAITRKHSIDKELKDHRVEVKQETTYMKLSKDNYVVLLSTFLALSIITFTFVDYTFKEVIQDQYQDQGSLRDFLGIFNGSVLIFSLLLQTFVNDKIIADYGLKAPLLILPIILGIFTLMAVFSGHYFGYSIHGNEADFFWFFLFISLSKLFNASLRESMENPSFKLYFMPLDIKFRFNIQAKVEGVINEMARLFAGVLILTLPLLSFFELIHYSYTIITFIGLYFLIIGKLYNKYRYKIKQKLEKSKNTERQDSKKDMIVRYLKKGLLRNIPGKTIFSFKLLEKIDPATVEGSVHLMMKHNSEDVREFAQQKIDEIKGLSISERYIIPLNSENEQERRVIETLELENILISGNVTYERVEKLSKSDDNDDRQYAAELIGSFTESVHISSLIELLHDRVPAVRFAAIKTARKKNSSEVISALIYSLDSPTFSNAAMAILITIGQPWLPVLDAAYYRTGQQPEVMRKIIKIFGHIGGEEAINLLWNKIDYPDRVLVSQVILALGECGFNANVEQASRIRFAIESDISDIAWNLAALGELPEVGIVGELKAALEEENKSDIQHIYMLLSMIYDNKSVQLVRENIESDINENITYAIELLDVLLSDDLKQKIIPILDDLSDSEKSRKLEIFFPREKLEPYEMLKNIINRDFNQSNRWSKACALYQIGISRISKYKDHLIANLFNPDLLIREVSAWAIYQMSEESYHFHVARLPGQVRQELDEVLVYKRHMLKIDQIFFLKSIPLFSKVSGFLLAKITDYSEELQIKEGENHVIVERFIGYFYMVYKGEVNLYNKRKGTSHLGQKAFVGELFHHDYNKENNFIIALQDTTLLRVSKERFYELLSNDIDFAEKVISSM